MIGAVRQTGSMQQFKHAAGNHMFCIQVLMRAVRLVSEYAVHQKKLL